MTERRNTLRTKNAPPVDHISEFAYGERAVTAKFCTVACGAKTVHGIPRTMLGGIVLDKLCRSEGWERWSGTMILVPEKIEILLPPSYYSLEQIMTGFLGHQNDPDEPDRDVWREAWKKST
jgi:hypothetical protein